MQLFRKAPKLVRRLDILPEEGEAPAGAGGEGLPHGIGNPGGAGKGDIFNLCGFNGSVQRVRPDHEELADLFPQRQTVQLDHGFSLLFRTEGAPEQAVRQFLEQV